MDFKTWIRLRTDRLKLHLPHWLRRAGYALGLRYRSQVPFKASVILLSYKRQGNIKIILSSVLLCDFIEEVLISNNNPAIKMEDWLGALSRDPRVKIINQPRRRYASVRFEISNQARSEFILAIDDDLFPTPRQLRTWFERLVNDPAAPRGFRGEIYPEDLSVPVSKIIAITEMDAPADTLAWNFGYTKEHLRMYFELIKQLGLENDAIDSSEDVLLSFTGQGHCRVDNVGHIQTCPSMHAPEIATYMSDGFMNRRISLVRDCRRVRGFASLQH